MKDHGDLTDERSEHLRHLGDEANSRHWEHRGKLSYYVVSLPFIFASLAIATYPYPRSTSLTLPAIEIAMWITLLLSGCFGLRSMWYEKEHYRHRILFASHERAGIENNSDASRLTIAAAGEEKTRRLHYISLAMGVCLLVGIRAVIAFSAALAT